MRDFQRKAVYRWEETIVKTWPGLVRRLDHKACRELVEQVWGDYAPVEKPPTLYFPSDGRLCAKATRAVLTIPPWAKTNLMVLHETAHSLLPDGTDHSPLFASFFLVLGARYAGVPLLAAAELGFRQRPRRVHFVPVAQCPQPAAICVSGVLGRLRAR